MATANSIADVVQQAVIIDSARFTAYDGSSFGPDDAPVTFELRSERGLRYWITAPGDLGLARAYVAGELELVGDMHTALHLLAKARIRPTSWPERLRLLRALGGWRLLRRPPIPPQEVRLRGRLHSTARDQAAISHHYDVSNMFYEWLLGESMTYTCAVYQHEYDTLDRAQWVKHDLVAGKLGLQPGMRLLDIGCGWGGMTMHAARHYGVQALGVTLSKRQAEWAQRAIAKAGLADLAEVRHLDYRQVAESDFDAISSIGLTEHVGAAQLPRYFRFLYSKLRTGGRLLNHCITRPTTTEPAKAGSFIGRYVFPDGELVGVGRLVSLMQNTGFEVRHEENLREHYALTLAAWSTNLEKHWEESVAEIGLERARVWRLYLAASRFGFDRNAIQLHQVLGVKTDPSGKAAMPLRPDWEPLAG